MGRGGPLAPCPLSVGHPQVRAHGPQLLTAMMGGLDDRDDPHSLVALEAMTGLARLLDLVERRDLHSVLLHVAIRIRPFFDSVGRAGSGGSKRPGARRLLPSPPWAVPPWHPDTPSGAGAADARSPLRPTPASRVTPAGPLRPCPRGKEGGGEGPGRRRPQTPAPPPPPPRQEKVELRSASIRLFGHLNKACHGACEDVFLEQVVAALVPLLLHLRDPQAPVTNVSRQRELGGRPCSRLRDSSSRPVGLQVRPAHVRPQPAARGAGGRLPEAPTGGPGPALWGVPQCHLQAAGEGGALGPGGAHWGPGAKTDGLSPQMHHFPELLGRLAATSLFYFKSSWEDVRAAAPMLAGEPRPPAPRPLPPVRAPPPPPPQASWCCTQSPSSSHRWTWSRSQQVSPDPVPPTPNLSAEWGLTDLWAPGD